MSPRRPPPGTSVTVGRNGLCAAVAEEKEEHGRTMILQRNLKLLSSCLRLKPHEPLKLNSLCSHAESRSWPRGAGELRPHAAPPSAAAPLPCSLSRKGGTDLQISGARILGLVSPTPGFTKRLPSVWGTNERSIRFLKPEEPYYTNISHLLLVSCLSPFRSSQGEYPKRTYHAAKLRQVFCTWVAAALVAVLTNMPRSAQSSSLC